jgi:predicted amidohydrolase YtcJ
MRTAMARILALIALVAAVPVAEADLQPPDLVLINGRVFTADAASPYAAALAIRDGRVVAAGSSAAIRALAGPHTRRIDLKGHLVIPGLNDAHCHLGIDLPGAATVETRDLDPSWAEVRAAILKQAHRSPPGTLIEAPIGAAVFRDLSIDRQGLDALSPDHPVILGTVTGHAEIANSAALALSGISEDTPDPVGGRIERDASGRHTGVLREYAVLNADRHRADATTDAAAAEQLKETLDQAAAFGITTLQDMANATAPERAVRLLQDIPTVIRVRVMRMPGTTPAGRDTAEGRGVPQHPGPLITVTGTKWLLDGVGLESTLTARAGNIDWHGAAFEQLIRTLPMTFPESEMAAMLQESLHDQDQLLLHVFGYPAASAMLDAMQASGGAAQWADKRVRFEHADGLLPDLIPRARSLGIVVVQNPTHFAVVGVDILTVAQPMRSLLDAGIPVALGSDGPLNPYLSIMLAVTHPHQHTQGITREEAVIAYTRTSAYAEFAEKEKGTLTPGKLADLAVLSQDIFKVPLPKLPSTKSLLTLVGGSVVYDAKKL